MGRASRDVGGRAVAWLAAEQGNILTDERLWAPDEHAALKSACDISLLSWRRAVPPSTSPSESDLSLHAMVLRLVQSPMYVPMLCARPRDLNVYGLPYAAARAMGCDLPAVRSAMEELVASGAPLHVERLPYRQLDLIHFLESVELSPSGLDVEAVAATTLLARKPDTVRLQPVDAYAIAHTVFYLTDFGRRALTVRLPSAETAEAVVCALLERFRASEDADLIAELGAALACLVPRHPVALDALVHLGRLQRPDGTIARSHVLIPLRAGASSYARRTWWFQHYHTALVTGLLGTLLESG